MQNLSYILPRALFRVPSSALSHGQILKTWAFLRLGDTEKANPAKKIRGLYCKPISFGGLNIDEN